jgi:hypothetical protein
MEIKMQVDLPPDHIQALLNTPHQIYLINNVLKSKIEAFKSEITFGNINPAGSVITAVSINLSTEDLYCIAKDIVNAIESKKEQFKLDHSKFINNLG